MNIWPVKDKVCLRLIASVLTCVLISLVTVSSSLANSPPQVVSLIPSQGTSNTNQAVYFTTTYSDADGYTDIWFVQFLINTSIEGTNCFYGYYDQRTNKLYLRNDANTGWLGGYAPGSSYTIENSYVKLSCAKTTVSGSGTTLTVKWLLTFKSTFTGTKNCYLYVIDNNGGISTWIRKGTWRINNIARIISINPTSGRSNPDQIVIFSSTFSDADGWQDINFVYLIVGTDMKGINSFWGYYNQNTNKLYLRNDAGKAWLGGFSPGSNNVIENSYARLHCASTTVSGSGTTMTVNWSVSFKPTFLGDKYTYLTIRDDTNTYESTIRMGRWKIDTSILMNIVTSMTGEAGGDLFGFSVAPAGDVNGDGFADLIVGAKDNDSNGMDAGEIYIYFGGNSMDNTPDVTTFGLGLGENLGYSVATAGDVNGDGYADVIVGAPYNDESGVDSGKVYIYFGGQIMDNSPDVIIRGETPGDLFGYSVASAGDVNGDGYSDVIIGTPCNDSNGVDAGKAYIYFGGSFMNGFVDITMTGQSTGDLLGSSVASAGDVNDDDFDDVVVGAPGNGKAYVYFGGSPINNIPDLVMAAEASGDSFGISVASAGDVNGDGFKDIVIGAEKNDSAGVDAGKAYIYFGDDESMDNIPDIMVAGEYSGDNFGHSVASAGDINGDGYSDIIVGSPYNDSRGTDAGKVYIFTGGLSVDNTPSVTITGEASYDLFGYSVSSAGDVEKTGFDKIFIGACHNNSQAGKAYIYEIPSRDPPYRSATDLLDETEALACKYFYEQILTTPQAYGLVKDTCYTNYSSIAATGFGLSALCILADRYGTTPNWTITPTEASNRANATLATLIGIQDNQPGMENLYGNAGFFYHFINPSGQREISLPSEVSTVDTAILLAGVLTAGEYFGGEVKTKADEIFDEANWAFFLNPSNKQFYHGWNPSTGMLQQTWDRPSDEAMLISILAIASQPQNQDFLESYFSFPRSRNSYASANETFYVYNSYSGALFTYLFAHCWFDFKTLGVDIPGNTPNAKYPVPVDWWENSKTAARANRQFCIDNAFSYSSYGENSWGLSSCYRPDGTYFGMNSAPPREYIPPTGGEPTHDGTVPPYGAISTLPFMKDLETQGGLASNIAYNALRHYYDNYYFKLWADYGPRDSFNHLSKFSTIYLGIDLGPMALMIENYRSGLIWNLFMRQTGIEQVNRVLFTDITPPIIDRFEVTDPDSPTVGYANSATVNVTMNEYDATGSVVKWLITETPAQPSASDFNAYGLASRPAIYTITSGDGLKRLYAWVMDDSNNPSILTSSSQAEIHLDTTAPSIEAVVDDGAYTALTSELQARWSGSDAESGIIEYQYRITEGSIDGLVIRDWTSTGTQNTVRATGLTLNEGRSYYFGVKARNGAGTWSEAQFNDGIIVDSRVPDITGINPADGEYGYVNTTINISPIVNNLDGDPLQYQFWVNGMVKQSWSSLSTYSWSAGGSDAGLAEIRIEVRDDDGMDFATSDIYVAQPLLNPPPDY